MSCELPPNEWTPVVGSSSQEVSNGTTSTSVVYGGLQAAGRRTRGVERRPKASLVAILQSPFLRFLFAVSGRTAAIPAPSASLASRKARRRSMFLRISMACRPRSAIARAPSSAANRCRLARAMLSGEGSADLLPLISHPNSLRAKPAPSPGSSGRYSHFSTAVKWRKWRKWLRPATDFLRLLYRASCPS
jgi:hypothetical protein